MRFTKLYVQRDTMDVCSAPGDFDMNQLHGVASQVNENGAGSADNKI